MAKSNFFKDNQSLIFGGVLLYLINDVVLSPLLENLGLKKSKAEVNILAENSNVTSAWNPQFWASSPRGALILTDAAASNFVEQIWGSVGYFNDDFSCIGGCCNIGAILFPIRICLNGYIPRIIFS
jgi:hypothetical protein